MSYHRQEKDLFTQFGIKISRGTMAHWTIFCAKNYLAPMLDYFRRCLSKRTYLCADETPVPVNKDGRPAGSKSFMWVYRSGYMYPGEQIVMYEYQRTRNASHPRKFLKDYSGVCVTDGYQVYHTVEKELEDLKIAGC